MPLVTASLTLGRVAAGEYEQVWLPAGWKADQSRRAIVFCHGAGSTFATGPIEKFIAQAGFPLIACDLGGLHTWGNDTSLQRVTDAWTLMKNTYGVKPDKVIMWGGSQGSLTSILYALDNPGNVRVVGVSLPIMDPEDVRVGNRGSFQPNIEAIYGVGTPVPNVKRPITRAASLSVPTRFWVSEDDPIGQPSIADSFIAAAGVPITRTSLGSQGHNYLTLDYTDAIGWLLPHRGDL